MSRFAERVDGVPPYEFYDVVKVDDTLWLAGDALYRKDENEFSEVLSGDRISALELDPDGRTLWYAASNKIGYLNVETGEGGDVPIETDFIWSIVYRLGKLWYFGSRGFGWIDTEELEQGDYWEETFSPRPQVMSGGPQQNRIFVSSEKGLWEITASGRHLKVSSDHFGGLFVSWMEPDADGYWLGTADHLYRWSGIAGDLPVRVESDFFDYFSGGTNNSCEFEDSIAVVDYPYGVVVIDRVSGMLSSYVPADQHLGIGDVYKVEKVSNDEFYMLGVTGLARVEVPSETRYLSAKRAFGEEDFRRAVATEDGAILFLDTDWLRLTPEGYTAGTLDYSVNWVGTDPSGNPISGFAYIYQDFKDGAWTSRELPVPVSDLKWGAKRAYAVGPDGVYMAEDGMEFRQIYPDTRRLRLVGEYGAALYLLRGERELIKLEEKRQSWAATPIDLDMDMDVHAFGVGESGVWLATGEILYRVVGNEVIEYPCAAGWQVNAISTFRNQTDFLYYNPAGHQVAIGLFDGKDLRMLSIPYLHRLGEPLSLVSNLSRIGVVGGEGVGWYARDELEEAAVPEVEFDLLLENRRIEDRTIPSGMHFIDLQVGFSDPSIPSQVEYRINDGRWRSVNLNDPSLTFAGHGSFMVELRAIHPNGNVSKPQVVQFGIAPPWYFNPLYQGLMLILALLLVWGLFYLRSAQLKKTNLWLQSEVKKQTRELEAATAARTNFLAGLSHDIRNPLNGVLMIAETLSRNPPKDGSDSRLRDLTEFGLIVDRMLGEILDFSAIDERNIPTSSIPVSLPDIIETSIKQNQFGIRKEMVTLQTNISPELKEVVVKTDRNWMIKILSNLIINALEYSESDRIEVGAICHKLTPAEAELEIYVADWGKGIDPSEREFVFERFYRGESGIESGKHGTGLGLSICQEIAHAMGAHLRLEGNDPSGCRFILKGKFERVESGRELDKEVVLGALNGKRVLIVDDLAYNRRSVVDFFTTLGCSCDEAENGREALGMLQENTYYMALLDWDLPGLTGPEIARRHRKEDPDDPVIMISVTAYTDAEKRQESVEAGMNGYISKPLTASRLAHCLANIADVEVSHDVEDSADVVDSDELMDEIYKHVEDCLLYGERYEWENLRRCAHRLTTLALIRNNKPMQQVCRDIQVAASDSNMEDAHVSLSELRKWRRP